MTGAQSIHSHVLLKLIQYMNFDKLTDSPHMAFSTQEALHLLDPMLIIVHSL